jgi:hypothetical protein
MLQVASIMPTTKSRKEVRALGARERLFWLMDQKHPAHLTVTAEVKVLQRCRTGGMRLMQCRDVIPSSSPQSIETRRVNRLRISRMQCQCHFE